MRDPGVGEKPVAVNVVAFAAHVVAASGGVNDSSLPSVVHAYSVAVSCASAAMPEIAAPPDSVAAHIVRVGVVIVVSIEASVVPVATTSVSPRYVAASADVVICGNVANSGLLACPYSTTSPDGPPCARAMSPL